jgi:Transposase DDE domain/Domain of unknown function (DUF4372)
MAFAQLTYRESLRDIEACLRAQATKLYHMGLRGNIARNTLANANATRDWRIYCDFAQRLIGIARRLYAEEPLGIELKDTVYALDSTTIDLCLSMFPWAPFRSTKAAVKLHTLLDLRGNIPSFIFISDGKLHDVNILDQLLPEAGAFYVMDRGYIDFERLARLHEAGSFFVTRAKSNLKAQRRYSHPVDRSSGLICDQTVALTVFYSRKGFEAPLRRIRFRDPESGKRLVFLTNNFALPALTITQLYRMRWQVELFFDVATQCTSAYVIEYEARAVQHPRCRSVGHARASREGLQHRFAAAPKVRSGRVASHAAAHLESISTPSSRSPSALRLPPRVSSLRAAATRPRRARRSRGGAAASRRCAPSSVPRARYDVRCGSGWRRSSRPAANAPSREPGRWCSHR